MKSSPGFPGLLFTFKQRRLFTIVCNALPQSENFALTGDKKNNLKRIRGNKKAGHRPANILSGKKQLKISKE